MEKVKLEKDGIKKIIDFALSNFVIIAFIILFVASCFLSPAFLTKNNLLSVLIKNSK